MDRADWSDAAYCVIADRCCEDHGINWIGGRHRNAASRINPAKLCAPEWQVNVPGADYDIWGDDVAFVGCA